MPVYEFRCGDCGARVGILTRSIGAPTSGNCERCGSGKLTRLISRVAVIHAQVNPDNLNKAELLQGVDYSNPASMANFFRKMGQTFQDEKNEHMDEIISQLDHGVPVEHALEIDDHSGHDHFHDTGPALGGDD
ncbi:MAG: zinc ribbon domain-containing protein [Chloroflexi bacterium]|nr:zinc ribbon domain-containing protein [Chloroflexota bacterium]